MAALVTVSTTAACQEEPRSAMSLAAVLPSRPAIHTEVHRRQLVQQLVDVERRVQEAAQLPTLCRLPTGRLADERALVVTPGPSP
ncbi:MAG: hypothetical protein RIF41_15770, partial [Polyangiaceae bacterium]